MIKRLLEKKAQQNASEVTLQLIKQLKVPVTTTSVIEQVESHPDYPSLLSISDSLKKWKVDNIALEIEADKLDELPVPFLAHTKAGGGNFLLVTNVNGTVEYLDKTGKTRHKKRDEFLSDWSRVALVAEPGPRSGEENYSRNRKKEKINQLRLPSIIVLCICLVLLFSFLNAPANLTLLAALLLMTKLIGSIVAALLLWFEIDKWNPVLQQICSAGKKTNCTAVLSSKSSKLFNAIGWSEIGFFYFAGGFIFLLVAGSIQQCFSLLSWLNLFALPYIIFSVLYQWRVAKQWCPLCLAVQALLFAEGVIFFISYWNNFQPINISMVLVVPLLASFLIPVFFWVATKKVYLQAQTAKRTEKEVAKFKYNKEIFFALLQKQKQITTSPEGLGIIIGNPSATNTIIKVCNPYCGPCAKAHTVIDDILENNDDVKVQIIFTATSDEKDERAKPVKHLMALYEKNNADLIKQALDDWYNSDKKDYDAFAQNYLLNAELQKQDERLEGMTQWCNETRISFTPTFFVNGYQLPKSYKIEDLKHLL